MSPVPVHPLPSYPTFLTIVNFPLTILGSLPKKFIYGSHFDRHQEYRVLFQQHTLVPLLDFSEVTLVTLEVRWQVISISYSLMPPLFFLFSTPS